MKSLLSVSLCLVLLLPSCAPSLTKGMRQTGTQPVCRGGLPVMLETTGGLQKYNMTIDFMKKHFSGLLLVKQTAPGTYRTLFSTHFGLSLFDFEITADSLQVHHCIEPMRKKKLLSLLHRDFSVLLGLNLPVIPSVAELYTAPSSPADTVFYVPSPASAKGYYLQKDRRMAEIRLGRGLGKTTFTGQPDAATPSFCIRHTGLRLAIGLEPL